MKNVQRLFPEAVFIEVFGHFLPLSLTAPEELKTPYKLCFPFAKGVLKLTGADRIAFVNNLSTQDIKRWKPGQADRCLFTDKNGKISFDTLAWNDDDALYLVTDPGEEVNLQKHLDFYLIMEDVQIETCHDYAVYYLFQEGDTPLGLDSKMIYSSKTAVGSLHVLMALQNKDTLQVLMDHGFQPIGFELFEELRPAFGLQRSGVDFNNSHLPQEAALEGAVSFNKGCYLGQEPISRVAFRGHLKQKLTVVVGGAPLAADDRLFGGGEEQGTITTGSNRAIDGKYYAIGYFRAKWILEGKEDLEGPAGRYQLVEPAVRAD